MDLAEINATLDDLRRHGSDHATVEVKRAKGGLPQELWETFSAFANTRGGIVLLGVHERDDFAVTGIDDPAITERQIGELSAEMEPPLRTTISTVYVDGRAVVVAAVPPVPRRQRPCFRRSLGPYLGSRVRVADGNRKLTEYEVGLLLADQHRPAHDQQPVADATREDLDEELLGAYLNRLRMVRPYVFAEMTDVRVLTQTHVLTVVDDRIVPTLAGVLSFAAYPQYYFPQLNITIVRYPTPEPGVKGPGGERFLDSVAIDGPIPALLRESINFLKRTMQRRSIVQGMFRRDEWEYPEDALREAIVNAMVHRDLSIGAQGAQVQVELYPDRLEVRNPGGLYGPVPVDDLGLEGTSSTRNQALLKILSDLPVEGDRTVCEGVGSGIFAIRRALAEAGLEPPQFYDNISTFRVVFPNHTLLDQPTLAWMSSLGLEGLTSPQMVALALARRGVTLTNRDLRAATGVADSREAGRLLKELVDRGVLVMEGTRGQATYGLPAEQSQEPDRHQRQPADEAVLAALRAGARTRGELVAATGLPANSVTYQLRKLRAAGQVEMIGKPSSKAVVWRPIVS